MSQVYTPGEEPDLVLHNVAFARLTDGRMAARGTAAAVQYRRPGGRFTASDVRVVLQPARADEFGAVAFEAPAVEGEVPARMGVASGGVQLHTERGDEVLAETLEYDGNRGVVTSDRPVRATGPGYQVAGNRLVASEDGRTVELREGARGQLAGEAAR